MPYAEVEKVIQEIDSLLWLRAERRFRVVWREFPRARATLEPAENLMPSGCAPRPFAYFPSLTTWCGSPISFCGGIMHAAEPAKPQVQPTQD